LRGHKDFALLVVIYQEQQMLGLLPRVALSRAFGDAAFVCAIAAAGMTGVASSWAIIAVNNAMFVRFGILTPMLKDHFPPRSTLEFHAQGRLAGAASCVLCRLRGAENAESRWNIDLCRGRSEALGECNAITSRD